MSDEGIKSVDLVFCDLCPCLRDELDGRRRMGRIGLSCVAGLRHLMAALVQGGQNRQTGGCSCCSW